MDVYFYEVFSEEKEALRRHVPAGLKVGYTQKTVQEAGHRRAPAPVLCIRTQSRIPVSWAPKLKGVFSRSKGFDHLAELKKKGVPVGSLGAYCSRAVAEQALLLLLTLWRRMPQQQKQFARFYRNGLTGREVFGKNALVLGIGDVGREIVRLCRGLGMHVKGVDLIAKRKTCPLVPLEKGLAWADVLFVALPLTARTKGLLNTRKLFKAKKGVTVINVARGEITPLKDLEQLLKQNHLGGVGMDVFEHEARLADDLRRGKETPQTKKWRRLAKDPRVMCTPHNAFNTEEALERKAALSARVMARLFQKGTFA